MGSHSPALVAGERQRVVLRGRLARANTQRDRRAGRHGQMTTEPSLPRVRILCLTPRDEVLLLKWRDPTNGHMLYEPPGGGVETGETLLAAAKRELWEETGLRLPLSPRHLAVARDTVWMGERKTHSEAFFLARVLARPVLVLEAQEPLVGHLWARLDELTHLDADLEPPSLLAVARLLLT